MVNCVIISEICDTHMSCYSMVVGKLAKLALLWFTTFPFIVFKSHMLYKTLSYHFHTLCFILYWYYGNL